MPRHVAAFLAVAAIVAIACGSDLGENTSHPDVDDVAIAACRAPVTATAGWTAQVRVTNHSTEPSDYRTSVVFGGSGSKGPIDTQELVIDHLLPGQATVRTVTSDVTDGLPAKVTCTAGTITRTASDATLFPPRDATGDVAISGCARSSDPLEGWAADLTITNRSTDPSDYTVTVAFDSADGKTQVDTVEASAEKVEHGQTVRARAVSQVTRGLPAKVTCRLAAIERRANLGTLFKNGYDDVRIDACRRSADPTKGWEADLSVTNSTPVRSTYTLSVSFVDQAGTVVDVASPDPISVDAGATAQAKAVGSKVDGLPTELTCRLDVATRNPT
jgi:hypothetical protein